MIQLPNTNESILMSNKNCKNMSKNPEGVKDNES